MVYERPMQAACVPSHHYSEGAVAPGIDHHQPSLQSSFLSPQSGVESLPSHLIACQEVEC